MTTFEDSLIETEENRRRRRRDREGNSGRIMGHLREYSSINPSLNELISKNFIYYKPSKKSKIEEIKPFLEINSEISKKEIEPYLSIKYNSSNIKSNYDLEEIIETRRGRRDREEIRTSMPLEYPIDFLQSYTSSNIEIKGIPRGESSFETSARMILGAQAEPKRVEALREALRQFQEGVADAQFGTEYLLRFLKQSWVITDKPTQNTGRNLYDKLLGKVLRKQTSISQPIEQASVQQEQVRELPSEELAKYALKLDVQLNGSHYGKDFRNKYFDTPFNFCLTYEGKLIASVGFVPDEGRVFVEQIQGIRGNHERLSPFKWERALVNYVAEWAQKYGIKQVSVTSVDNNKWAHKHGHLEVEQGRMLYDVTAKRSGFKRGNDGDYHRYFGKVQDNLDSTQKSTRLEESCLAVA